MNSQRIELLKNFLSESPNDPFLKYALAKEYEKGTVCLPQKKQVTNMLWAN